MTATVAGPRMLARVPAPTPHSRIDEERYWLREIADGQTAAFDSLWGRYRLPCHQVARRVLRAEAHVEDVVQLVFLDVWRQAGRFDPQRATVAAWVLSMAHHKAVDRVRYEQVRLCLSAEDLPDVADDHPLPDALAWRGERRRQVRRALFGLNAAQRETIMLAYFGEYTYREIAVLMDVPLGTAKARGRAGLVHLRSVLEPLMEAV